MQTYRSLLRNLLVATTSPIAIAMVILFGLIAFTAYEQFTKDIPDVPAIKQGQLSLPSDQNMPISLQGNWRFYWQQLLTPQDLTDQYHLITVPSRWRDVNIDGISLSAPGFATYAATVEFDRRSRSLGLRLPVLYRAATVWVNGEVVAEIGRPGATAKEEIPRDEIKIIPLPNTAKKLQLVIQVSSFHHVDGGLSLPVVIDDLSRLEYAEKWRIVRGI
ncbi:MAG TPA: hypothetical protein VIC08_08340, partial [Cellvibrionaceae bacterium]